MPHLAAIVPSAKAPLELKEVETPQPGPNELLIKVEIIALQPVDAKLAKLAMLPLEYPTILGNSYGGTVASVGAEVANFQAGDKVVAWKTAGITDDRLSAYQQYAISTAITTTKVPSEVDLDIAARLVGNLPTVPALFNATLKLSRPTPGSSPQPQGKKILVYGGTSSVGSLSVQYLKQAGYEVVTTSSPKHQAFVSQLGASQVIDHSKPAEALAKDLIAAGPYDIVFDTISTSETVKINADVLAAQGGSEVYALQPSFGPEELPAGITRKFEGWSFLFGNKEHSELLEWTFRTYLPKALASNNLTPVAARKVDGGLAGLNDALNLLFPTGVSSEKVLVDLRD